MTKGVPTHNFSRRMKGLPRKGSKRREILRLLLRPEGLTHPEAFNAGLVTSKFGGGLVATFNELMNSKGWDIRTLPCPEERRDHCFVVYKCVGRMRWSGKYRSFIRKEDIEA